MTDAHVPAPETSERGFQRFHPIAGLYGGSVQVYESSLASQPALWLNAVNSSNPHETATPGVEATIHLSLVAAKELRDELDFLLANHYQVRT